MKTMTCKQLGGACHQQFSANTFEEIAKLAQTHGMAMFEQGNTEHLEAMQKIRELMKTPEAMQKWMDEKREEFEALPEDA